MIFFLLALYQIKHLLADYFLQTPWMLKKFSPDPKVWVPSLAAHAGVHALMTLAIVYVLRPELCLPLAVFDFVAHFVMDRIKASPKLLGRYKALSGAEYMWIKGNIDKEVGAQRKRVDNWGLEGGYMVHQRSIDSYWKQLDDNTRFWWALGFDQSIHHLTHYAIIYVLTQT